MAKGSGFNLRRNHRKATMDLANLNREMAVQMIVLASETGDTRPLIDAVKSLRTAEELYQQDTTPIENAEIHKKLGDVLLKVGKNEDDMEALDYAIIAYRGAITIASLLGAEALRAEARKNYAIARSCRGISDAKPSISLMGAA
jgi:tetratricopeptide (TPR) repeat protein